MVSINIKAEFGPVLKALDGLQSDLKNQVLARTLNRIADSTRTEASREISRVYNIKTNAVKERIQVRRAFAKTNLSVEISVRSKFGRRATNLITFGAKQLKAGGVSVKIRRDKPPKRGNKWFIITNRKTQGTFVARRVGPARKDIASVSTIDVGPMFNSKAVNAKLLSNIRAKFPAEFEHNLRRALTRFK